MRTLDEFIQAELDQSGKRVYTLQEVADLAERYRLERIAAAEPFQGWLEPCHCPATDREQCASIRLGNSPEAAAAEYCQCECHGSRCRPRARTEATP